MTGYGQGSAELPGLRLTVELRSVNNRFTDLRFRLPQELAAWEADVRRRILKKVRRGRVELSVRLEPIDGGDPRPQLNRVLLDQVLAGARTLEEDHGLKGEVDVSVVLGMTGMFRLETLELQAGDDERAGFYAALDQALAGLDGERLREGGELQSEMLQRVNSMKRITGAMRERAETLPDEVQKRLLERLQALTRDVELDPARVAQEAAVLADRTDVTEELVRLEGHLEQAGKLLSAPDGERVGKRMDFLLQEIHRETNTVTSKSSDLELTRQALDLKVETEKVREQTQNIE